MHTVFENGSNVPAFLAKLWKMVEDPSTNDLIFWSPNGTSFLIRDQVRFCKELLPMYYKHNNMASFIRQLNMYGFHKIVSVEAGSAKLLEQDENEFHHPCFVRDHPYMLEHIKRKITGSKIDAASGKTDVASKVLTDVRQMRNRQETMDSRLSQMKLENEALWRELAILRQKHMKQQQIVNKLIQFLVLLVKHPENNGITVKRRNMPLMLQDKFGRHRESSNSEQKTFVKSPSGPIIHELDPAEYATALLDTVEDVEGLSSEQSDEFITVQPSNDDSESLSSAQSGLVIGESISPEDLLMESDVEILPNSKPANVANTSFMKTFVRPSPANAMKIHRPTSKRTRQKKKKPQNFNDGNSLPMILDTVISNPSQGINHVTPDSFSPEVEIDSSINLEDLAKICAPIDLISNAQPAKSNITSAPVVIENQRSATGIKNNLSEAMKAVINKRYNIGKNASTLFKSKKTKVSNSAVEKKEKRQPHVVVKSEQPSPKNETADEIIIRPTPSPAESVKSYAGGMSPLVSENNIAQNKDLTVAGTTGNSVSLNRPSPSPAESVKSYEAMSPLASDNNTIAQNNKDMTIACTTRNSNSLNRPVPSPAESVRSHGAMSPLVPNNNISQNNDMTVACTTGNSNSLNRYSGFEDNNCNNLKRVEEMDFHIDSMQNELDSLKEFLKCENLSLDANALLGLFNSEESMACPGMDVQTLQGSLPQVKENEDNSNQITMYSAPPSILDFNDVFSGNEWSLPVTPDPYNSGGNDLSEDLFPEINTPTPTMSLSQPSFGPPAKKRKK